MGWVTDGGTAPGGGRAGRAHVSALRAIPRILERFKVSTEPILRAANLTLGDLEDAERSASYAQLDELIGVCVHRTKCPHFGLLLGQYVNLQSFGIAGRLARNAPTVGEALQDLSVYFALHDTGGSPSIAIHEGAATFAYGIYEPGVRHTDQVYDLAAAAMCGIMRQLCGVGWRPDAVLLPRKRPADLRPYREFFAAPLRFDAMQAAVVFPEVCLTRRIPDADSLLHRLLADHASAAVAEQDPVLYRDVRRTIRVLLTTCDCSRREVARRLGLHERALGRRLQATGTTFQELLDDTRTHLAKQLLHDTSASVARIAASLGYSDPTVFTRAFRRWTGLTPRQFRVGLPRGS